MAINKTLLAVSRAVHIYLTMLGLLVMLLFAITGFTLNHEGWFRAAIPVSTEAETQVPSELVARRDALHLVEHLRQAFQVRGAMTSYAEMDDEIAVSFRAPGETVEISLDKASAKAKAHRENYNLTAVFNNLHRGRYTGPAWSWIIDLSALLVVLACATGFVLWLALPKRRRLGIAFLVLGTFATMAVAYFFVPGPDAPPQAVSRSGR